MAHPIVTGPTVIMGGDAFSNRTVTHMQVTADDATQMSAVTLHTGKHASTGAIERIVAGGKHSGLVSLLWDATTDVPVLEFNVNNTVDISFKDIGGLPNPNTAGATGNVNISTTGMASGDHFFITLYMRS